MNRQWIITALLLLMPGQAETATQIWLSPVGIPDGSVTVGNYDQAFDAPGGSGELKIWIRPEVGQPLDVGISLNLLSTNTNVIDFTDFVVHNPRTVVAQPPPLESTTTVRWEYTSHGEQFGRPSFLAIDLNGPNDNDIFLIQGFSIFSVFNLPGGEGAFATGLGHEAAKEIDPLYDSLADAWLFATVQYDVVGTGTTDLFLRIGALGMRGKDSHSNMINVVFGDGSDSPLNADYDRLTNSATPDGSITVGGSTAEGDSPENPIMPSSTGSSGEDVFDDVDLSATLGGAWFDSRPSTGLSVEVTDGQSTITAIELPSPEDLADVDGIFEIWSGDDLLAIVDVAAEPRFVFPSPVQSFVIRGIDSVMEVGDTSTLPVFLSFNQATVDLLFRAIPEPTSAWLGTVAFLSLAVIRLRRHFGSSKNSRFA